MCFSAAASFTASGVLAVSGAASIREAYGKPNLLPFAGVPFLFAIQQAVEGMIWLSLTSVIPTSPYLTKIYLFFAGAFWPIFIPLAIYFLEPRPARKKILMVLFVLGSLVGGYGIYYIVANNPAAEIANESIRYYPTPLYTDVIGYLYAFVVVMSFLVSSRKYVPQLGILVLISLIFTMLYMAENVVSVWCFFAALISALIYVFFKEKWYKGK